MATNKKGSGNSGKKIPTKGNLSQTAKQTVKAVTNMVKNLYDRFTNRFSGGAGGNW